MKDEKNISNNISKRYNMTRYYRTRAEAEANRTRRGERIYYEPGYGYYIIRPKKREWWDLF